jgi:hypothetical protein
LGPANLSRLAKRLEKPLFLFRVEGSRVHDLQSAPQWLEKRFASASTAVNVGEKSEATPTCW